MCCSWFLGTFKHVVVNRLNVHDEAGVKSFPEGAVHAHSCLQVCIGRLVEVSVGEGQHGRGEEHWGVQAVVVCPEVQVAVVFIVLSHMYLILKEGSGRMVEHYIGLKKKK